MSAGTISRTRAGALGIAIGLTLAGASIASAGCTLAYSTDGLAGAAATIDATIDATQDASADAPADSAADAPADASPEVASWLFCDSKTCSAASSHCCLGADRNSVCTPAATKCDASAFTDFECQTQADCDLTSPGFICCVVEDRIWPDGVFPGRAACLPRSNCGGRWELCDPAASPTTCAAGKSCGNYGVAYPGMAELHEFYYCR